MNDQFLCYSIMFVAIDLPHSGLQKKNFLIGIVKFSRSNEGAALTIRKDKRWRKWSDITRYVTGSLVGNTSCQRSCRMNRRVVTHCVLVVPQGHSATAFIRPKPVMGLSCLLLPFNELMNDFFFFSAYGSLKCIYYLIGGKRPRYQVHLVSWRAVGRQALGWLTVGERCDKTKKIVSTIWR